MAQSILSNRKTAQQSLRAAAEDLAGEIATLNTLEPAALLQEWKALFGTDPSALLACIFMRLGADGAVWSEPFSVNRKAVDTLAAVDKLWLTKGLLAKYRTSFD